MATSLRFITLAAVLFATAASANGGIGQPLWHGQVPPIGGPTPIDHIPGGRMEHFPRVIGWGDGVEHPPHHGNHWYDHPGFHVPNKWPCDGHVCYNIDPLP
jgi:hypothetical protein